jgi:hypothetical protein
MDPAAIELEPIPGLQLHLTEKNREIAPRV